MKIKQNASREDMLALATRLPRAEDQSNATANSADAAWNQRFAQAQVKLSHLADSFHHNVLAARTPEDWEI